MQGLRQYSGHQSHHQFVRSKMGQDNCIHRRLHPSHRLFPSLCFAYLWSLRHLAGWRENLVDEEHPVEICLQVSPAASWSSFLAILFHIISTALWIPLMAWQSLHLQDHFCGSSCLCGCSSAFLWRLCGKHTEPPLNMCMLWERESVAEFGNYRLNYIAQNKLLWGWWGSIDLRIPQIAQFSPWSSARFMTCLCLAGPHWWLSFSLSSSSSLPSSRSPYDMSS